MQFLVGFIAAMVLVVALWIMIAHFDALVNKLLRRDSSAASVWWASIAAFVVVIIGLMVVLQPGVRGGWGVLLGIGFGVATVLRLRKNAMLR
jgi:Flp pilus assembly pilin Flp